MGHSSTVFGNGLYGNNGVCSSAQQPECVGGGVPVTAEEMREVMYKPQTGEWGERSRDDECERIIAGIEQLITVGKNTHLTTAFWNYFLLSRPGIVYHS